MFLLTNTATDAAIWLILCENEALQILRSSLKEVQRLIDPYTLKRCGEATKLGINWAVPLDRYIIEMLKSAMKQGDV